ncbi:MAG: hypothetical protein M3O23_12270, partial [Actinomycetota bacterium]|nr:hypothetical protein [Actinomycetota bacterium]
YRDALSRDDAGDSAATAEWLEGLAAVAVARGGHGRAATLLGAASAVRRRTGAPLLPHDAAVVAGDIATTKAALGEEAFTRQWDHGRTMPLPDGLGPVLDG